MGLIDRQPASSADQLAQPLARLTEDCRQAQREVRRSLCDPSASNHVSAVLCAAEIVDQAQSAVARFVRDRGRVMIGAAPPDYSALAALLERETGLPKALRRRLAVVYCDLRELHVASDFRTTQLAAGIADQSTPELGTAAPQAEAPLRIPTPILYQLKGQLMPPERMAVGAVRPANDGLSLGLEAFFDVTGEANPVHVEPDRHLLMAAFVAMSATGTYFGLWAHTQPGSGPEATHPSEEDSTSYRRRLASGDSAALCGAIFAGNYVRFWPAPIARRVELVGAGLHQLDNQEDTYVFEWD